MCTVDHKMFTDISFICGHLFLLPEIRNGGWIMSDFIFPVVSDGSSGASYSLVTADLSAVYKKALSSTNLAAGSEMVSSPFDIFDTVYTRSINLAVQTSQNGLLKIEQSDDGMNTWSLLESFNISGGTVLDTGWKTLSKRYYRIRVSNSGTDVGVVNVYKSVSSKNENAMQSVIVANSNIQQPIDIQSRYSLSVQTHSNKSINSQWGDYGADVWIDTDGFANVGLSIGANNFHDFYVDIAWSNDGINVRGLSNAVIPSGNNYKYASLTSPLPVQGRYCKVLITNKSTSAKTYNAWVYLTT